jgi:hypothetical protein
LVVGFRLSVGCQSSLEERLTSNRSPITDNNCNATHGNRVALTDANAMPRVQSDQ